MTMSNLAHEKTTPSSPYPDGWFALCFASDLKSKAVKTLPFMGKELVLYRTESGVVRAVEPFCPHLGAHLGRGGKIVGETIVCPFHHFAFTADGHCLHATGRLKPPIARLAHRQVQEWNGLIFVWQGPDLPHAIWKLPDLELAGFSTPLRGHYSVSGNLQNITENAFDVNHFDSIHGWQKAVMQPPDAEDHQITVHHTLEVLGLTAQFKISLYGLGIMVAHLTQKQLGLQLKLMVTPRQIGPEQWAFQDFMVLRVARFSTFPRWIRNTLNKALAAAAYHFWFTPELKKDISIWKHRYYGVKPKLTVNEGPVLIFRRWAMQFYPPHEAASERQAETLIASTRDIHT